MKQKIIYTLLLSCISFLGLNAQIECVNSLDVTLDENGEAQIMASDLVPNVEFYIATGTVTYFIIPFNTGVINSGSDLIEVNCNAAWSGQYIVEFTQNGQLIESCSGNVNISDPLGGCPNYSFCEEAELDCKKAVDGFSFYSLNDFTIPAENFAICAQSLDCQGDYGVAIGQIADAANLIYSSTISSDNIVDYITPIVLSYTENGVTEYDNSIFYAWQNLECYLIPKNSRTIELDLTAEAVIVPAMFLESENTCSDIQIAVTDVDGVIPSDFFDNVTLDCADIGYHTVYLKDELTGMIGSCQLFLADPLEVCGPILGPGDKLIKMANNPPLGTYAKTEISVNGEILPISPTGKGWIINEDLLVDGMNTLNFDSGSFMLNGVSTLDLLKLLQLIISDQYNNPMESIVMDVDGSGYNGIGDLVLTRSLILGYPNTIDIPNVLFKPVEFNFPTDFSPFDFDYNFTKYDFQKEDYENLSFRFEAYKVGDINGTAATEDSLNNNLIITTREDEAFEISNMEIEAGTPFTFSLGYGSGESFKGLLVALVSSGITFESLHSEQGSDVYYNVINGKEIRISYVSSDPSKSIEKISFEIEGISSQSGELIDLLGLKSGFPQEVINENDEVINIENIEVSATTSVSDSKIDLELNLYPNPVSQKLSVSIASGEIGLVHIFDPIGRRVLSGYSDTNKLKIDVSRLTKGLYYIVLENHSTLQKRSFLKL